MGRSVRYLVPLAAFLVLAGFLYKGLSMDPREIPSPLIGKPLPEFSLPSLKDPQATLTQQELFGKVALLNVWATWCPTCRAEHAVLVQLSRTSDLPIYGIDWKDERAAAQDWLQRLGNPYVAIAFDKIGRTAIDLGVYGAPETFLVDAKGIIRYKHAGAVTEQLLRDEILPLVDLLRAEAG